MIKYLKKYKYIIFGIMGVLVLFGSLYLKKILIDNSVVAVDSNIENIDILNDISNNTKDSEEEIYLVDIKGAINNPGVYKVPVGTRVNDQTTPNMIQKLKV